MSLTPNYGFNIPTGTDAVNLLTQNYPNFTSLDSILKTIELTGITTATCTKVGTVFQLVRTNSAINVIRFVATGNYAAGDTFTIDGVAVTATAVDGSSIPGGAFVINQSVMAILNGSVLTVLVSSGASTASGITYDNTGSGLVATNVQDAIDEIVSDNTSALSTLDAKYGTYVTGTITAGSTSITLSNASITTSSFIDVYFKDSVNSPTNVQVTTGSVTIEISALPNDQDVAVRITNL